MRRQAKEDLMNGIPGSLQATDRNNGIRRDFFFFLLLDMYTRGDLHKYGH